ncbi:hypothetical protein [Deinococcus cellulosilyticus]|uniref:Uncharacterized protein n=1 Tax=Deinococcus cellulosilyticus (strain DSM 18568 / NBRC 106333 / KACC 11606 / 5516J-15) TaxID=1223518 RepID=A0A511N627_DEIC1|nr:hypothetical protein [Deinococcus cellulosilyticus]GEM47886.1 hypothetical protein DC3_35210 [Deinococcus cellulosilyticus NBRC 106333 = KACC 11606]
MSDPTRNKSMVPAVLGMGGVVVLSALAIVYMGKPSAKTAQTRDWTPEKVLQTLQVKPVKTAGDAPRCSLIPDDPGVEVLKNLNTNGHSSTQLSVLMDAALPLQQLSGRLIKSGQFETLSSHANAETRGGPRSRYLVSTDKSRRVIMLQQQARCLTVVALAAGTALEDVAAAQVKFSPEEVPPLVTSEPTDPSTPALPAEVQDPQGTPTDLQGPGVAGPEPTGQTAEMGTDAQPEGTDSPAPEVSGSDAGE